MKKNLLSLIVLVLLVASFTTASAAVTPVVYNGWQSGNAAFECGQIGDFEFAYKVDAAAPNGSWTVFGNTITIYGSDGSVFNWLASKGIGAVIVKAGTGANVFFYNPQSYGDTGLYAYENREVSHVTFCWDPEPYLGEWCSPGYWRQTQHLGSWTATGIDPGEYYNDHFNPDLPGNPTLWQVLQSPQTYGGKAFNNVGDLLSGAHPDVDYKGVRVEDSCPLGRNP